MHTRVTHSETRHVYIYFENIERFVNIAVVYFEIYKNRFIAPVAPNIRVPRGRIYKQLAGLPFFPDGLACRACHNIGFYWHGVMRILDSLTFKFVLVLSFCFYSNKQEMFLNHFFLSNLFSGQLFIEKKNVSIYNCRFQPMVFIYVVCRVYRSKPAAGPSAR